MTPGADARSPAAAAYRALYHDPRWLRRARYQLKTEPLCRYCRLVGRDTPATVADHVEPHRGDREKFFRGALQSLCDTCHSSVKQQEENGRGLRGCDLSGLPVDSRHPWS